MASSRPAATRRLGATHYENRSKKFTPEKCPPGRPKNGHPAVAPTPVPTVHWRRGGRYCLPTILKYRARFLSLAAPLHTRLARPSCCAEPVGAKRARPPPPPGMAAAPKPGMIAEIGGSPTVKNLA
jgi:hypothetical protein